MISLLLALLLGTAAAPVGPASPAAPPEPPILRIRLAHGSDAERRTAEALRRVVREHDVARWVRTDSIVIDEDAVPHSHPVLTLHTRHLGDDLALLDAFVHEELHWFEEERKEAVRDAIGELRRRFPEVPVGRPDGGSDEESTYLHLVVCRLEYEVMAEVVGTEAARRVLEAQTHYVWIYDKVLNDPAVADVLDRRGLTAEAAAVGDRATPDDGCRPLVSRHFAFHSDPWINLHHFLFQWARNLPERLEGDRRPGVDVPEREDLEGLPAGERQAWDRAVSIYRRRLAARNLQAGRELIALRGKLANLACSPGGLEALDPEVRSVLTDAMPVYRRHWWPGHDARNRAWIEERLGQLRSYEETLAARLADAYGGEWPPERVRVDVAAYSHWTGAYTTNRPNQVTLSAGDYPGLDGLEILFHEVSHASFFEQRLLKAVSDAFRRRDAKPPERLFHVIQFVTPAELLRSLLPAPERQAYRSVAEQVLGQGASSELYDVVRRRWVPFLDGRVSRSEALVGVAAELSGRSGEPLP